MLYPCCPTLLPTIVLTALQTAQMRNLPPDQMDKAVGDAIRKYMPMSPNNSSSGISGMTHGQLMDERRKDHVSHFILRLAYSRRYEEEGDFL